MKNTISAIMVTIVLLSGALQPGCATEESPVTTTVDSSSIRKVEDKYTAADVEYINKNAFREESVTIGSGKWALPGTLTIPTRREPPFPAVVLVHGGAPFDRDETRGPNKPFRDLAWGLASNGIVVLRYDKRSFVYARELQHEKALTINDAVIDDAKQAIALLQQKDVVKAEKIFLLGHSQGASIAPEIARQQSGLAGIILMSAMARPREDAMLQQFEYLSSLGGEFASIKIEDVKKQVERIKKGDFDDTTPAVELLGVPGNLWKFFRNYDPVAVAAKLNIPMLILQGARDYQVTAVDYELWQKALATTASVTFSIYPRLNHNYQEGRGNSTPAEYLENKRIPSYVVLTIANWIGH